MPRLFKESEKRKYAALPAMWDFAVDRENIGISEEWYKALPKDARRMPVPSCWNTEIDLFRYMGTAWYSCEFTSLSDSLYINFEAVQNEAEVWLDGVYLGNHYGGFLEFGFEAQGVGAGVHRLTVRVDNTVNSVDTFPLELVDWYNYGGIARAVSVLELPDAWIADKKISYELSDDNASAELTVWAKIKSRCEKNCRVSVSIGERTLFDREVLISGEREICVKEKIDGIRLWDIDAPSLYSVKIEIPADDICERIGFRKIETSGKKILLNGKEIKILGVNRHEEHPDFGFSVPFSLIKRDIDIIRDMNCNAIRASHYNNSKMTADYCDEVGMLFWTEIPAWNRTADAMASPLATSRALKMAEEMVKEAYHHPSIIVLSLSNEGESHTDEGYAFIKALVERTRELDKSRLITIVSNKAYPEKARERCFGLCDIVCLNHYIGWYFPLEDGDWDDFMEGYNAFLMECDSYDKPFVMSEFGIGGIYGANTFEANRWTEDYQSDMLELAISQLTKNPTVSGTYIWQFADNRSCIKQEIGRPRGFNNKGILDEYRRPKRAYRTVRRLYGEVLSKEREHYKTVPYGYTGKTKK
jgi:beta-glucuronidase